MINQVIPEQVTDLGQQPTSVGSEVAYIKKVEYKEIDISNIFKTYSFSDDSSLEEWWKFVFYTD